MVNVFWQIILGITPNNNVVDQMKNHLGKVVTQPSAYLHFSLQYLKNLSTESLENLILSGNKVADGEINKLINKIIRKLDLIAIVIENDKVDSEVVDWMENSLKSS